MWIISKTGFVSLVEHDDDTLKLRARARRREHLVDTFGLDDADIIDLGPGAPDYRWHADVYREEAIERLADALRDLNYTSHVKEEVSGDDKKMSQAMFACWYALQKLQEEPLQPDHDFWRSAEAQLFEDADEDEPTISERIHAIADRMVATPADDDGPQYAGEDYGLEDDIRDALQAVLGSMIDPSVIDAAVDAVLDVV
jgi:hypothetical protein